MTGRRASVVLAGCALALVTTLGLGGATAWGQATGGTFAGKSYGADFADVSFGDACDYTHVDGTPQDFRNDWFTVRFHGRFDAAPWHVDSVDVINRSPVAFSSTQPTWTFYVQDADVVRVPIGGVAAGETVTFPVDVTVGGQKLVAVVYPVAGSGVCGQARLLVERG